MTNGIKYDNCKKILGVGVHYSHLYAVNNYIYLFNFNF